MSAGSTVRPQEEYQAATAARADGPPGVRLVGQAARTGQGGQDIPAGQGCVDPGGIALRQVDQPPALRAGLGEGPAEGILGSRGEGTRREKGKEDMGAPSMDSGQWTEVSRSCTDAFNANAVRDVRAVSVFPFTVHRTPPTVCYNPP
ncbi:MAG: hypothetical protein MZV70_05915 [Desulfobacterales bacterium]|nr:hypothetical protein [Desulfobacterales bacterium]